MNMLNIIAKNTALVVADTFTAGVGSKIKDTLSEIEEYTKQCNDSLYSLQIETFLNTVEIDQTEFENFIKENPDNLRLGLETIKILEKTFIEKQAEMLARAFKFYVSNPTEENKSMFNKFVFIINKLDRYLMDEIEAIKKFPVNPQVQTSQVGNGYKVNMDNFVVNPTPELATLGFLKRHSTTIFLDNKEYYGVTPFFKFFYENIYIG